MKKVYGTGTYDFKRHRVAEHPLELPSHPAEKPLEAKPGSNLPSSITLSEIQQDRLTKIAEESRIKTGGKLPEKPFDPEVVKEIYVTELKVTSGRKPVPLQRVMILEVSQYLENYLWPNFDPETATLEHVMSMILMINEKFRENVAAWICFHDRDDLFKKFLQKVLRLKEVGAIISDIQPGLTMVVGPPGTGKTDTAVQILNVLYHNCPSQRTLIITHSNQALNDLFEKIMERDVPARYLLRLGQGEQELATDLDFSRKGHVNAILFRRLELLSEVDRLAKSLQLPEDVTCETAGYFWLLHVYSRWELFLTACAGNEGNRSFVRDRFTFKDFFSDTPKPILSGESIEKDTRAAKGCFSHLKTVFQELEECRAFELLKSTADRANYLMTKQAKIVAIMCTHTALKSRDFLQLEGNLMNDFTGKFSSVFFQELGHGIFANEIDDTAGSRLFDDFFVLCCERFLEFLIDMLNQLPTRRYLRPLVADMAVVAKCRLSALYKHEKGKLFAQLVDLLQLYENFEMKDHDGTQLTDDEALQFHYDRFMAFQPLAFKKIPKLQDLHKSSDLRRKLSALSLEDLRDVVSSKSLEDSVVNEIVLSLAGLQSWHSLSYGRFQMELCLQPDLIKRWKKSSKNWAAEAMSSTIVAFNSSTDQTILRFLFHLLLVSSCTASCTASTNEATNLLGVYDEQQQRLPMDQAAGSDKFLVWLVVAFLLGVVFVPLFKKFLSWCKGSKKIKKRKSRKVPSASVSTQDGVTKSGCSVLYRDNVKGTIGLCENDDSADGINVDKLFVTSNIIGEEKNGYVVFEGIYEPRRLVAVKRINLAHPKTDEDKMNIENDEDEVENLKDIKKKIENEIDNEISILNVSDAHPNVIRFYGIEHENDFVYLCLERWKYSLADLPSFANKLKKLTQERVPLDPMEEAMLGSNWWKAVGSPSPVMIDLISNVVSGLEHLHKLNIIHRNLSPSNVIIICNLKSFVAKLSGMRISKRLPLAVGNLFLDHHATCFDDPGWEAPEQIRKGKETFATDMFRLGCVIFFALTGVHPFGCVEDRSNNIKKNFRPNFKRVTHPEASHLIHSLLNPSWSLRPTATNVLLHPFFWISDKRLNFLRDASDMIEANNKLWDKLRDREKDVEGCKEWNKKLDNDLVIHIQRKDEYGVPVHREYNFKSLRHLLRLIRNEISHHLELPENIKGLIGTFPEGYDSYFTTRFPKLFIVVYQFVSKHFMEENALKVYLK